jgi:hypothetical protein
MQTVAEQINEMQKIFEEYGSFFETVMKKCKNDRLMVIKTPNLFFNFPKTIFYSIYIET